MISDRTASPEIHPVRLDHDNGGHVCVFCGEHVPDGCYVFSDIEDGKLTGVEADANPDGPGNTVMHACGTRKKAL